MGSCAIHVTDLHVGRTPYPGVHEGVVSLVAELRPEVVLATGDLAHRGTAEQLAEARALFADVEAPLVAVPGNHDIPYRLPSRFTSPWALFEASFGSTDPVYSSDALAICGLNSVRPWRHQSGRLSDERLARVAEVFAGARPGALKVVALHHHLAGSPWRAARKQPLADRDRVLGTLATHGAELVVGGHIHQSSVVERHEIEALDDTGAPLVLATAPGLGRPRPHRQGEAHGLHVYRWDERELSVETRIWDGEAFRPTAQRSFPRTVSAFRAFG